MSVPTEIRGESCLLCGVTGQNDIAAARFLSLPDDGVFRIWSCSNCSFRWLSPMPSPDQVGLYGHTYFEDDKRHFSYQAQIDQEMPCLSLRVDAFRKFSPNNKLLDVGCATGEFLTVARKAGMEVTGVEFSGYASQLAREKGLTVHQGDVFDDRLSERHYGGVSLSHVLEHLPQPTEAIERISRLLVTGGILYVEVPYQFDGLPDLIRRIRGKSLPLSAFSFHHRSFFSPKSISLLLGGVGFEIVEMRTFLSCKRAMRTNSLRKHLLQSALWLADKTCKRGDVISVWARWLG